MKLISYFEQKDQKPYFEQICTAGWSGAASLAGLLESGTFFEKLGDDSSLLILEDEGRIAAFCTLAEHDDVPDTDLGPWIGYVFTDPDYRGQHLAGRLMETAERRAAGEGKEAIYISTGHEGLYEKYGYDLFCHLPNKHGVSSRIYRKKLG